MTSLIIAKQAVKNFYGKYEIYIQPVLKFLLGLLCIVIINKKMGYMTQLTSGAIVLVVALMCSFMPLNFIVFVATAFVILHMYKLSLECAIVLVALFLILFLLYFRFSPSDTIAVLLTPISFILHVPYVMPIAAGLLGTPMSMVSVGCGVVVYYVIDALLGGASAIGTMADEEMVTRLRYVIDTCLGSKPMLATVLAFAITILLVYAIRRLRIDYSWTIAIGVGAVADIILLLIFDLVFDTNISIGSVILGTIFAVVIAMVINFLFFQVDYTRTEKLQFEDDDYYYYVKAVPKVTVPTSHKKVKKINSQKRKK